MNYRQGMLVTAFSGALFMNFASIYWTMWSVLSTSLFMLMITDFMFFEVRAHATRGVRAWPRRLTLCALGAPA